MQKQLNFFAKASPCKNLTVQSLVQRLVPKEPSYAAHLHSANVISVPVLVEPLCGNVLANRSDVALTAEYTKD